MPNEEFIERIRVWIRQAVLNAGCRGLVLGMSGGLDSSVTAVLCKKAFPDAMLGIIMPCYSDETDKLHAQMVAEKFSIPVKIVNLDEVYSILIKNIPFDNDTDSRRKKVASANIKPRLRMTTSTSPKISTKRNLHHLHMHWAARRCRTI